MTKVFDVDAGRLSRTLALAATCVGLFISLFLSWLHYSGSLRQFCGAQTGCSKVLTSGFSHFAGFPTAFYGFAYYLSFLVLLLMIPYVTDQGRSFIYTLGLALHSVALIISVFLTLYSLLVLRAICQYCLISTAAVIVLFGITLFWRVTKFKLDLAEEQSDRIWKGATVFLMILFLLTGGLYYRSISTPGSKHRKKELKALTARGPTIGDPDAPIRVLEFYDLACPHCRNFTLNAFPKVRKKYIETGIVAWTFMELPSPGTHPHSLYAHAFLSRIPDNQYLEAKTRIMRNADRWIAQHNQSPRPYLDRLAGEYDLTTGWVPSEDLRQHILQKRDFYVEKLGISSTPSFLVNGKLYRGNLSLKNWRQIVNKILGDKATDLTSDQANSG
ncbi:MAG: thioredoxin domain-containing protein [bacterium]